LHTKEKLAPEQSLQEWITHFLETPGVYEIWNFFSALDTNNVGKHPQGIKTMPDLPSDLGLLLKKIKKAGNMQSADLLFVDPAKLCLTCSIFLC
jgi:hypothetical protein